MPEPLWVAIPDITDCYKFVIHIEHENPISLGNLGQLLWALDESLRASSGRYMATREEFRVVLEENKLQPFEVALRLSLESVERGSWIVVARVGGAIALGVVSGLLGSNIDRMFQTWGADAARYVQNPNAVPNALPVERACEKAMDAAQKLNATRVICSITGPNGQVATVEFHGPNTGRGPAPRRR